MTYAECSHLYILRRAVRRNLRRCHRHSSPTYPTYSVAPSFTASRSPCSLHLIAPVSVFYRSLSFFCSFGAFTDLLAFLISFSAFLIFFFFILSCTLETSIVNFFFKTDTDISSGKRRFFQSPLDYSNAYISISLCLVFI